MKIDIRFSSGMILHEYEVKEISLFGNWLKLTEDTGAITSANLNNVDIFTVYGEENDNVRNGNEDKSTI